MVNFECKEHYNVNDFREIISLLRGEGGCPWDREQTHESIRRNLLEEAYEVCEAIDEKSTEHLREELGDLLMQILFHSDIEEKEGRFDLDDVADEACKKLILRHPHVFGDTKVENSAEVLDNWDAIKRVEKHQETTGSAMDSVARSLPALWRAEKVQKKARKAGFDWTSISGAVEKLNEEVDELHSAIKLGEGIEDELGDVLFSVVNISRFADVDPETALHAACEKFIRRYKAMEDEAKQRGLDLAALPLEEQDELYQLVKIKKGI